MEEKSKRLCLYCRYYNPQELQKQVRDNPTFNLFFDDGMVYKEKIKGEDRTFELDSSVMGLCTHPDRGNDLYITYWNGQNCEKFAERVESTCKITYGEHKERKEEKGDGRKKRKEKVDKAKIGKFRSYWQSIKGAFGWWNKHRNNSSQEAKNNNP